MVGLRVSASQSASFGNLPCKSAKLSPARSRAQRRTFGLVAICGMWGCYPRGGGIDQVLGWEQTLERDHAVCPRKQAPGLRAACVPSQIAAVAGCPSSGGCNWQNQS